MSEQTKLSSSADVAQFGLIGRALSANPAGSAEPSRARAEGLLGLLGLIPGLDMIERRLQLKHTQITFKSLPLVGT